MTSSTTSRASTRWVVLILLGEVGLSLALGFYRLGHKSLWYDEGFSAMASSRGLPGVLKVVRYYDSNMPMYNGALSVWRVVGAGEVGLRSFSVVATAAAVVAIYFLAARLFDRTTGLIAGLLLAVAPFAVRYSQEVRGYGLLLLMVTLGSYCFVVAVETKSSGWFAVYAVVAAASCYAHLVAIFVIAAQVVSLAFLGRRNVPARKVVVTLGVVGVLLMPLAVAYVAGGDNTGVGTPTWRTVPRVLAEVGGGVLLAVLVGALCLVPVVLAWRSWREHGASPETWRLAFVLTCLVVPFLSALVAAVVAQSNWASRYLIIILPALLIAASVAIRRIGDRRLIAGVLVLIAVLAGVKTWHWYTGPAIEDWRGTVAYVERSSTPEDGIVFCVAPARVPFEYYALRSSARDRPQPLSPADPWGNGVHMSQNHDETATTVPGAPDRIWVVSRYTSPDATGVCDIPAAMAGRTRAERRRIGNVLVERYDR